MPLIDVTLSAGAFSKEGRDRLAAGLSEAAYDAESIPADPARRLRTMVTIRELESGAFYAGGAPADGFARAVLVFVHAPGGVLDGARRARFVANAQAAAATADPEDGRLLAVSVILRDTPEGTWGAQGKLQRLPDFAADAGYEHLTAIARS